MSTTSLALLPAASEGHEAVWDLPLPAWSYGAIALAVFVLMLGIAWAFRNSGHTLMTVSDTVPHGHPATPGTGGADGDREHTRGGRGSAH